MLVLLPKVSKIYRPKALKINVSNTSHLFDAPSLRNPHKYLHKPYIATNDTYFRGGLQKCMYFETDCTVALQGHLRSLIFVPIKTHLQLPINSNLSPSDPTPPLSHLNFGDVPLA